MSNMSMNTYYEMLEQIKLNSQSEIKGVKSRPFCKHVLMPLYQHSAPENYSLIYLDFNRLTDINNLFSEDLGDKLLAKTCASLNTLLSFFFPNTNYSISRVGGDEFLILVDTSKKEKVEAFFQKFLSVCSKASLSTLESKYKIDELNGKTPKSLDFSYGIVHSDEQDFKTVYNKYHEAEKREAKFKLYRGEESPSFEKALKLKVQDGFHHFFKNLRLSKYLSFDIKNSKENNQTRLKKDVRNLLLPSIDLSSSLLSDPTKLDELSLRATELENPPSVDVSSLLASVQCKEIYEYLQENSSFHSPYLNNFNHNQLTTFLNVLVREPVSDYYDKFYFQNFFEKTYQKEKDTFSFAMLADLTNMKKSNEDLGHFKTDENIKLFSNQVQSNFEGTDNIHFSEKNFELSSNNNYAFSLKGGKFLFLFAEKPKNVSSIVETSIENCEPLGVVSATENIKGQKNLSSVVKRLEEVCEKKKESLRQEFNFSDESLSSSLLLYLAPAIEYYMKNHPSEQPLSMASQKELFQTIGVCVLEQVEKCSKEYQLYQKNKAEKKLDLIK